VRRCEEGFGDLEAALLVDLEARSRLADMNARLGGELTAGGGVASNGGADFVESEPEHFV
jgi:hypothetical protein